MTRRPALILLVIGVFILIACDAVQTRATGSWKTSFIEPGRRVGNVRVGSSMEDVVKVCGAPVRSNDYAREHRDWRYYGLVPEEHLPFVIGFDTCLYFDGETAYEEYPVWRVFFTNKRATFIMISSFIGKKEALFESAYDPVGFYFGKRKHDMITALGDAYLRKEDNNIVYYHYLREGITLLFSLDRIRVIHLYAPFTREDVERFYLYF